MDLSILELWANDGIYDSKSDQDIASLTLEDVLDKVPYMYYVTTFLGFFEPPPTVSLKTKTLLYINFCYEIELLLIPPQLETPQST